MKTKFSESWMHFNQYTSGKDVPAGKSSMWKIMIKDFDFHRNS